MVVGGGTLLMVNVSFEFVWLDEKGSAPLLLMLSYPALIRIM